MTWAMRAETRSPSGIGQEWTHSAGWTNKKEAQLEADFHNRFYDKEIYGGVERSIHWFIVEETL